MKYSDIPNFPSFRNDTTDKLEKTMAAIDEANSELRDATAAMIEKRGFTYQGDKHGGWGLGAGLRGSTGFSAVAPYYGRGIELQLGGFSLQPFGIGGSSLLAGGGVSSSIFNTSGAATRFSRTTHVARIKMAMAVEAYKGFGIVKNVIDLMCNFASEGLTVIHKTPAIQRFYQRWFEITGMDSVTKHILRSYYKTGNVHIYTTMGEIDDATYSKMRSTRGRKSRRAIGESKREIPWRYTILNPFQMELVGNKFIGGARWVFLLDDETKKDSGKINGNDSKSIDDLDETKLNLPEEFKSALSGDGVVHLNPDNLHVIQYMKDDHEDWADPMVWPVMNDIIYKNSLRAMDMSVVNSTINAITIFKLGLSKEGFVAPESHYKKLSEMLRTPTYSHNLIWNDAISMESNYPPIEKILSIDKYKSVDRDILAGLGIPGILVNGAEGGSYSNAFLQVRTLLERLEDGRTEVMRWINKQIRLVAEVMGHKELPVVKFGHMSLRDEQAEKQLIIQLLDRNIISAERVHEVFGIETAIEIERLRREKKLSEEEDILMKFGPFRDPMNMLTQEEVMEMEFEQQDKQMRQQEKIKQQEIKTRQRQQRQQQQRNIVRPNGRPGGTKGIPQQKKRVTKPVGMGLGSIVEYESAKARALLVYDTVEKTLLDMVLGFRGLKYKKQLSREDRENLESLTYAVFSNTGLEDNLDENYIVGLLDNICVNDEIDYIVGEISNGQENSQERRELRAAAMAMYHIMKEN